MTKVFPGLYRVAAIAWKGEPKPQRIRGCTFRRGGLGVAVAVIALAASACGSTVQWSSSVLDEPLGNGVGEGTLDGIDERQESNLAEKNGEATAAAPDGVQGSRGGNSSSQDIGTKVTKVKPEPGTRGKGYTAKEIYVGYATFKDADSVSSRFGSDAEFGDQESIAKVVINDINRRGGIAGRKIVPVFYDVRLAKATQSQDSVAQEACTRWTEDRPVFAVINPIIFGDQPLAACLSKRQTPQVASGALRPNSMFERNAPYLYAPGWVSIERLAPVWMGRASENGYFDAWDSVRGQSGSSPAKIGILSRRDQYGADFRRIMRGQLSRMGHTVSSTFEWSGDFSRASDEMGQAAVRFRQAGVTHVIPSGGGEHTFFMVAADSQNYRPKYSLASIHVPQITLSTVPKTQLAGAVGVGLVPSSDVGAEHDPGPTSEAQTRCRKLMEAAGQNTSNRSGLSLKYSACDGFQFIKRTVEEGGLSSAGIRSGMDAVGSMPSARIFRIKFERARFDGAAAVRDLVFKGSCGCFQYVSKRNFAM